MTPLAYCCDNTDYYTHAEHCTTDPIESAKQGHEVYVLPANGYFDAPIFEDGKWPKRVNGAWENVENHIGEKGYINGVPTEIKEYGPLQDGWSTTPPPPTLEDQLAAVKSYYAAKLAVLDTSMINALWAGGGTQEATTRASLAAKRQKTLAERSAAIQALAKA